MLTLGDLLGQARGRAGALEAWLDQAAPQLADRLRAAAAAEGLSPAAFTRAALVAFDREADDAAWTRLTGRLHDAPDPGLACLEEMVRWRLARPPLTAMETAR